MIINDQFVQDFVVAKLLTLLGIHPKHMGNNCHHRSTDQQSVWLVLCRQLGMVYRLCFAAFYSLFTDLIAWAVYWPVIILNHGFFAS